MDYNTWKTETSRGLTTPRSPALKRLDTAFEKCKSTNASLVPKKELFERLKDWVNAQSAKGSHWKQSTRNATKVNGKGTVERLFADFAQDPYFAPQVLQLNVLPVAPLAPVSNAYVPGKWDTSKDQDGKWYEFIRQEKGNSCVCATIVMVKRAHHNLSAAQLSEEEIRGLMALEETGNFNQGISAISAAAQNHHDWDNVGTGPDRAVRVLKATPHPIASARKHGSKSGQGLLDDLRKLSRKKPGLIGWRWTAGGGHFTMCCGPTNDNSKLIIVDPWNGIRYVDNTLAGFTSYEGGTGTLGDAIVCF